MVRQKALTNIENLECSSRKAESKDFARNAYWEPSHDFSSNPLSPTKKESLRSQMMGSQARSTDNRAAIALYETKSSTYEGRKGASLLDASKHLSDNRVQDLLAPVGTKQRRHGNIPDNGPASPSGFPVRELGQTKPRYQSEQSDRYKTVSNEYMTRFLNLNRTVKFPTGKDSKLNANAADGSYLYYSRGFGDSPQLDHTAPGRRGCTWVGTAPVKGMETISHTIMKGDKLEFQARVSLTDVKSKVLTGTCPKHRHTVNWKSMYSTELSNRMTTPNTFRVGSLSADWSATRSTSKTLPDVRPSTCVS
eukprot:gene21779-28794_t